MSGRKESNQTQHTELSLYLCYRARVGRSRSERADRALNRSEPLPSTSRSIPTRQLRRSTELRCSHPISPLPSTSKGGRNYGASKGKDSSKTPIPSTSKDNVDTCTVKTENAAEEKEKAGDSLLMDVSEQEGNDTEDDDGDEEGERESDTEDMEASAEEGDRLSEMSDSFSNSSLYRSRIPVPIAGSFGNHLVSVLGPGLEVIKLFLFSTQLSMKFIILINVKMPSIVGILIFMRMINTTSEHLKA